MTREENRAISIIEDLFKNILYFQKTRTFGSYQMLDEIKTQKICMGHLCWSDNLG